MGQKCTNVKCSIFPHINIPNGVFVFRHFDGVLALEVNSGPFSKKSLKNCHFSIFQKSTFFQFELENRVFGLRKWSIREKTAFFLNFLNFFILIDFDHFWPSFDLETYIANSVIFNFSKIEVLVFGFKRWSKMPKSKMFDFSYNLHKQKRLLVFWLWPLCSSSGAWRTIRAKN